MLRYVESCVHEKGAAALCSNVLELVLGYASVTGRRGSKETKRTGQELEVSEGPATVHGGFTVGTWELKGPTRSGPGLD